MNRQTTEIGDLLFPDEVSGEADYWNEQQYEIEDDVAPETRHNVEILLGKANSRGNDGIKRQKEHGEDERSGDG